MEIKIIPYCLIDGIPTFKDSEIMELYDRMEDLGRAEAVFFDGLPGREGFLNMMKHGPNRLYILQQDRETIGLAWLNGFSGKTAFPHFCFLCGWHKAVAAGKHTLHALMSIKDDKGQYLYDLFKGFTPSSNPEAVAFVRACGAKTLGVVPNAVWVASMQRSDGAEFFYYIRGDQHEDL